VALCHFALLVLLEKRSDSFSSPIIGVTAYSVHDELIESVEQTDKTFCIVVQWHPERNGHIGLYPVLVEAARGS